MTADELRSRTRKQLAEMARDGQVAGWHGMKKEELVRALLGSHRSSRRTSSAKATTDRTPRNGSAKNGTAKNGRNGHAAPRSRRTATKSDTGRRNGAPNDARRDSTSQLARRILTAADNGRGSSKPARDRLVAHVHDAYWLHVYWTLTRNTIDRAEAALGIEWHSAQPVIRVYDVTVNDDTADTKTWVKDVAIHGNIDHWYIPVDDPPRAYRLHIGYRAPNGQFFTMARSEKVNTPVPGTLGTVDRPENDGTAQYNNSRLNGNGHRSSAGATDRGESPVNGLRTQRGHYTNGASPCGSGEFEFQVNAEIIIHGSTDPRAQLTLQGEPVELHEDGTFSVRFSLPNGRQIIPAVVVTPDATEQRTIILGIERNTKELEPQPLDELS